ncbi:MAG TPA: glycosyltransferase family 4 protein [Mycobacteriales bacterium]|nr:glycosyltransferase family 4 protein [Mycobacteriales bacterium]
MSGSDQRHRGDRPNRTDQPNLTGRIGRIGLAPARYGAGTVGGAEVVLAEIGHGLRDRGWDVEILTTCATDHFGWANELPAGLSEQDGLRVRRFPAVFDRTAERDDHERAILAGQRLPVEAQQRWMNGGMRVPELYHHLLDHAEDYRALVFGPYPFWVAFACSQVAPSRSMLWTCLHDEPYAYLDLFTPVLTGVAGLFFQTRPEHDLAHRVASPLAPHAEVGCPVPVPAGYDPEGFRRRYRIAGRFVLYAGRREGAKGWDDLLTAFAVATERSALPFSLVTMGAGPVNPPAAIADRVVDVGFLPDHERDNAFAAADAYLQPSRYEAFSRTIMEAWLAGTPVIGNSACEVVAWHCRRSGAGLLYDDDNELEQCLRFVAEAPSSAAELARSGRAYVLAHYTADAVLDRVERGLRQWTASPAVAPGPGR